MPELMVNEKGQAVDGEGKVVLIDNEPITLKGVKRQEDVDLAFAREKDSHKKKLDELNQQIKVLEEQANRSGEVQKLLDKLKDEKGELQKRVEEAERNAEAKIASQLTKAQQEAQQFKEKLEAERTARVRDQVVNLILAKAAESFTDPATDVAPNLLSVHKREPKKDAEGKDTGEFLDVFKLRFKNEKGEDVEDWLPVDKALAVWGEQHPHHVKASGKSGSGGMPTLGVASNLKRSQMTDAQKAEFAHKYGFEKFQALPE